MKIALYGSIGSHHSEEDLMTLLNSLDDKGFRYQINIDFAKEIESVTGKKIDPNATYSSSSDIDKETKLMVCYGGDGTFLAGVRLLYDLSIPLVGVNSGRLGFLANIPKEDMESAFEKIKQENYLIKERTLLEVSGDFNIDDNNHKSTFPYAFNEFSIQRQCASMISTEVYIGAEMIATYWGDGVLISTPTGSTAYSLSVGGPVVAPDCNCLVISPISPHNLTMRPVVIPDSSVVTLKVNAREGKFLASLDNQTYSAVDGAQFKIKKAKKSVFLIEFQNISFYDTLRNKMMWGIDRRDSAK